MNVNDMGEDNCVKEDEKNKIKDENKVEDNVKLSLFYLLGIFYARGSKRNKMLILETFNGDFVTILKNKIEKISKNVKIVEKKRKDRENVTGEKIVYRIVGRVDEKYWKIFQDDSIIKKELLKNESTSYRRAFLRGFFDAKGFLNVVHYLNKKNLRKKRKIRIRVSSYSFELLEMIRQMIKIEGINSRVYCSARKNSENKLYVLEIQGRNSILNFKEKIGSEVKKKIDELEMALRY